MRCNAGLGLKALDVPVEASEGISRTDLVKLALRRKNGDVPIIVAVARLNNKTKR